MDLLITVLIASFVGSLHCVGMCGPLVAFAVGDPTGGKPAPRVWLHAAYHGGRLLTYTLVGAVCGLLGAAIDCGGARLGCHRAAALLAGTMMIAVGLAAALRAVGVRLPDLPLPGLIHRLVLAGQRSAFALTPLPRALSTGLLTAFLPCGWLYLFALKAAETGSPFRGALFMIAFWLGSVPALILVGAGVQTLARLLGRHLPLVTAMVIVLLGVFTLAFWMHTPVLAFEPVKSPADAMSVKQIEELGKSVPPCCGKQAKAAENVP
ncbi:MAG: sulfite exporter TauE/SafE family protein [Thermoguttaceae bacterium]